MTKPKPAPDEALAYVEGSGDISGVPARNLTEADIASVAFDRLSLDDRPATRGEVTTDAIDTLRDELIGTGKYRSASHE